MTNTEIKNKVKNRLIAARDQAAQRIPTLTSMLDEGIDLLDSMEPNAICPCMQQGGLLESLAGLCEVVNRISDRPGVEKQLREAFGIVEQDPIFDPQDVYDFKTDLPPHMRK